MKRAAYRHPKMKTLARLLGIPLPHAIGVVELLLDFAGEYSPRGDVGRFDNLTIADACCWPEDDADRLIDALTTAGWLDTHSEHRLVIHDLADHAEEWIKRRLQRSGERFIDAQGSDGAGDESDDDATAELRCRDGNATASGRRLDRHSHSHCLSHHHHHPPTPTPTASPQPAPPPPEGADADDGGGGGVSDQEGGAKASANGRLRSALTRIGIRGKRLGQATDRLTGTGRGEAELCRYVAQVGRDTASAKSPGAAASARILDPSETDLLAEIDDAAPRRAPPGGPSDTGDAQRQAERAQERRLAEQRARAEALGDADFEAALAEVSKANPAVAKAAERLTPAKRRRSGVILAAIGEYLERQEQEVTR